jgi:hypothetical protein
MGEIEPSSDDASLSTVLVYRADGFTLYVSLLLC